MASDEEDFSMDEDFADDSDVELDDDDDLMDNEHMYSSQSDVLDVRDKGKGRAHDVEFSVHSSADIVKKQETALAQIRSVCGVKNSAASILLHHFAWNTDKLIERYMEDPEATLLAAGVFSPPYPSAPPSPSANRSRRLGYGIKRDPPSRQGTGSSLKSVGRGGTGSVCQVCFEEDENGEKDFVSLDCGHRYCKDCYEGYLNQKIVSEGESIRIQCIEEKCKCVVDEDMVKQVVTPVVFEKYRLLLNRAFVSDLPSFRYCPAAGCDNAIECHVAHKSLDTIVPTVTCTCGQRFCFGCGLPDHQPCLCAIVKLWLKKCKDDSETANWISANTKECPKCESSTEKNGGCNHMTCKKCKYEYCWVCRGEWSQHGTNWYNCVHYQDKGAQANDAQSRSRAALERYLHYYNRFANHEQSAKLEKELYSRVEHKMEEIQASSELSWIECQFMKNAVDTLHDCRQTLKWTYAMAFYMARNNFTHMFENLQADLEIVVDQLSELIEKPIDLEKPDEMKSLRQQVTDKTVYLQKRNEIVLDDALSGYQESRWEFTVPTRPGQVVA